MKKYLLFGSMGFELIGIILGGYYLGELLDQKYNSNGIIFVGLSIIGLIGWLIRIIWLVKKFDKDDDGI